jgi:hypothetical protein
MAQIGAVLTLLLRSPDAEEVNIGELCGDVVVGGELQPSPGDVVAQNFCESRFIEGNFAGGEFRDLAGVDIDADDMVAHFGHPGGVGCAQITGPEDGASHGPEDSRRE